MQKHPTTLTFEVSVMYDLLEEKPLLGLPEQVDISSVWIELKHTDSRRGRVNVLDALDESAICLLEDEILEHRRTTQAALARRAARKHGVLPAQNGSVTAGDTETGLPVSYERRRVFMED
ncbi:MAG: hypothetical protein ACO3FP_09125 [Burkholderiales bacterium]